MLHFAIFSRFLQVAGHSPQQTGLVLFRCINLVVGFDRVALEDNADTQIKGYNNMLAVLSGLTLPSNERWQGIRGCLVIESTTLQKSKG